MNGNEQQLSFCPNWTEGCQMGRERRRVEERGREMRKRREKRRFGARYTRSQCWIWIQGRICVQIETTSLYLPQTGSHSIAVLRHCGGSGRRCEFPPINGWDADIRIPTPIHVTSRFLRRTVLYVSSIVASRSLLVSISTTYTYDAYSTQDDLPYGVTSIDSIFIRMQISA